MSPAVPPSRSLSALRSAWSSDASAKATFRLEGLRQAEENDDREAALEYNQALDDLAVADLQFFQQFTRPS